MRVKLHELRLRWKASYGRVRKFRRFHKYWPNLFDPQTFNEKILYRSIFDRRPLLHVLSDKLAVRSYVRNRVGENVFIPNVLFSTADPEDLLLADLPPYFVMKSNHGQNHIHIQSGEKADRDELVRLARQWLAYDNYEQRGQWCYKDIPKTIFVEEHLTGAAPPDDIKFFCFDGVPALIELDANRLSGLQRAFFDPDWRRLEVTFVDPPITGEIPRPSSLGRMIGIARQLSAGLDFIRVDLYDLGDRIGFGEMTCYPHNGNGRFNPPAFDRQLGARWKLKTRRDTFGPQ